MKTSSDRNDAPRLRGGWAILLVACVLPVCAADALLIEISQTFFTAGFNGVYIAGVGPVGAFAAISFLADLCLAVGVWALLLPGLARRRGTVLQKLAVASLVALAIPFSIDFVRYQVGAVVGRMTSIQIVSEVSGGGFQLILAEAAVHAGPVVATLLLAALLGALAVFGIGRLQRAKGSEKGVGKGVGMGLELPSAKLLWSGFAWLLLASTLVLVATDRVYPRLSAGLAAKPSVSILTGLIRLVTDFDRDGFGLLSRPSDPAPFDGSRHPYAIDHAGNGIDENGMAGDLPADVSPVLSMVPGEVDPDATRRPDFLLVYLESFRADLLGRERSGQQITPFLNALARDGASSDHAYVHSPYTIGSRAQLFSGTIHPRRDEPTLVDDFQALGYTVAHFSGQDDSFGGSVELLGLDRVDHLYDARQDRDRRTSRGTSAGSLQISWKLLVKRVDAYLDGYFDANLEADLEANVQAKDVSKPLFLYVNIVDTHFPYTHEEIDDLLGVSPLTRYEINVRNAERVRATYDNTAANVDRAVRKIVERFRKAIGGRDHAILVTSDHGQALFERDSLGHGQSLTQDQTRAPFILWGIGGEWPEPLGIADVRALLLQNLFVPRSNGVPRARFVPDPKRRLLHFISQLQRPHLIGLRSLDGLTSFDFDREALELYGADEEPRDAGLEERTRAFEELIQSWEATQVALPDEPAAARTDPGPA